MENLDALLNKEKKTPIESVIFELWDGPTGFETLAGEAADELATLRALLGDAMKALEPFAKFGEKMNPKYDTVYYERPFLSQEFLDAASVHARIKATQTGGE